MSFIVKDYDNDLIAIYNLESMSYSCICEDTEENKHLLDEIVIECNQLCGEVKHYEEKLDELEAYMGRDKHALVLENLKLRRMLRYQQGVFDLEKKYFGDVLNSLIDEYPESNGLRDFRNVTSL